MAAAATPPPASTAGGAGRPLALFTRNQTIESKQPLQPWEPSSTRAAPRKRPSHPPRSPTTSNNPPPLLYDLLCSECCAARGRWQRVAAPLPLALPAVVSEYYPPRPPLMIIMWRAMTVGGLARVRGQGRRSGVGRVHLASGRCFPTSPKGFRWTLSAPGSTCPSPALPRCVCMHARLSEVDLFAVVLGGGNICSCIVDYTIHIMRIYLWSCSGGIDTKTNPRLRVLMYR